MLEIPPNPTEAERTLRQLAGPLLGLPETDAPTLQDDPSKLTEARYRTLLEQIPAVTFMASFEQGLSEIYVSPQIESLLGYTQKEWLENPILWYERLHPEERERWNLEFARTVTFGESFHSVYRFLARDGRVVWILGDAKIVRDDNGQPLFIQGVGFDITDLKTAEEALQAANRELESFSYSVSHDLRTPLRALEGYSELLLHDYADKLDSRGRQYLERVQGAAQRMAKLIDEFLGLHRITRKPVVREQVDLSSLAESIAGELAAADPKRSVRFRIEPGRKARGDEQLLRAVLENLLDNAWKFTGKRSHATIEFGETLHGKEPAFFVRDNGVGFDMKFSGKLFRPFERLHPTEDFPGSGIGLATVQKVIERHGGKVWAEGAVGAGAAFYFTLPG